MRLKTFSLMVLFILAGMLALAADEPVKVDSSILGGLSARAIGPATMGGRISAIDGVGGSPSVIYVGAASGGVWKSTDSGTTFKPVFDDHVQSIGAIAIDQSNPQTVWVGTGESWMRNSVSVGDGVYKTSDGGTSWTRMGLEDTEHIARVAIDPKKSDNVFVCATGHLWNSNQDRGVFKTTDGGKTWKKVLYVDENTGCSDLAVDPQEPSIVYAGMWNFRRQPDFFRSGGKDGGIYKSTDGGEHWTRLTRDLPAGDVGRVAIAIAPSRPSVLYALVESKDTALYRSDDLGEHWANVNNSFNVTVRPFYFARLVVDPTDYNRVYKPGLALGISTDGGKSFTGMFSDGFGGGVHGDHHAVWVNPKDPADLLLGTDGGVYSSRDKGAHWRFLAALPVSQFYHVAYDMDRPYNVYGGLQDNGSWMAPSNSPGGIANRHWRNIGFGDGFATIPDRADNDVVYVESQGGAIVRVHRSTGEAKDVKPLPAKGDPDYRFNWNTPIVASPNKPGTIYLGGQFLFRSSNQGDTWERISPDLTTNDPKKQKQLDSGGLTRDNSSAENFTTIITISESPKSADVIWVGTDDGNAQVTQDGGKSWTNVAKNIGVPANTWVSRIDASHFDAGTAYATFDGHRTGDMKTYIYKTTDFGKSWTSLATSDVTGFAQVVREDLVNPNLLFAGTESGLFISLDGGANWAQFTEHFPHVAVDDIQIHPREADLILATHGRGIYIVDDITALRSLKKEDLDKDVVMLPSRAAEMSIPVFEQRSEGDAEYVGPSISEVAPITYYLKKRHLYGDSRVEVYDAAGKLVSTLPAGKRRGLNRVDWAMRLPSPKIPAASSIVMSQGAFLGPRVPEGTYTVKLIKGKDTYTSQVQLVADARAKHSAEDRALQQKTVTQLYGLLDRFTFLVERVVDLRDQANARAAKLGKNDSAGKEAANLAKKLDNLHQSLVATREGGWLSGEEQLREKLGTLYGSVNTYDGRPTDAQLARTTQLADEVSKNEAKFDAMKSEIESVNRALASRKAEPLKLLGREEWEKKAGASTSSASAEELQFFARVW